ncbi:MAG: endonuclease/exonuclease/phosphatase family protein [Chrysiogenetes bacterium]|nr:endonuclease/exonuclease/phosphatase family protein [Chrysiogenetes bacterium]
MQHDSENPPSPARRAASLLLAASLIWLALATLLGFLGRIHWFLDLFAHFRAQYAAVGLLLAAGLALLRHWRWLAGAAVLTGVNAALLVPLWIGPGAASDMSEPPLRVFAFNVFAGNSQENIAAILEQIQKRRPDIVVLLETRRSAWQDHLEAPGYELVAHTERNDTFDLAVLSAIPGARASIQHFTHWNIPAADVRFVWQGREVALMAAHPTPPTSTINARARSEYLREVAEWAGRESVPVIVAGDLNATPWSEAFARLLEVGRLENSQRGFGIQPTWCDTCGLMRIPIDHVLHSPDLVTTHREVGPSLGSDHSPVYVELRWRKN